MSSLSRQLEGFRAANAVQPVSSKTSFLFDKRDIMSVDKEHLAQLAYTGFNELVSSNTNLSEYSCLFDRKQPSRDFLSATEAALLDSQITGFLISGGYSFLEASFQSCLEYLIQTHSIHTHLGESILLCMLPFHDTEPFGRLLATLPPFPVTESLPLSKWGFLGGCRKSIKPIARSQLVSAFRKSAALTQTLLDFVGEKIPCDSWVESPAGSVHAGFLLPLLLELLAAPLNFEIAFTLQPFLLRCLRKPGNFFFLALAVITELSLLSKGRGLSLLRKIAVKNSGVEELAEVFAVLGDKRSIARRGEDWGKDLINSCRDCSELVVQKVIKVLSEPALKDEPKDLTDKCLEIVKQLEGLLQENSMVIDTPTHHTEAPIVQDSSESSSDEEEQGVETFVKKDRLKISAEAAMESLVLKHFPVGDELGRQVWGLLRSLHFSKLDEICSDLSQLGADIKQSDDLYRLLVLIFRASGEYPSDLPLRIVALKEGVISRNWRKIVNKLTEEFLFAEILISKNKQLQQLVLVALCSSPKVRMEISKMLRLYAQNTKEETDGEEISRSALLVAHESGVWRLVGAAVQAGLVGKTGSSVLLTGLAGINFQVTDSAGEAAEVAGLLLKDAPQGLVLPIFGNLVNGWLGLLESAANSNKEPSGEELLVPMKLLKTMKILVDRFGAFFADASWLNRLLEICTCSYFRAEEECELARQVLLGAFAKIPISLTLETIKQMIMQGEQSEDSQFIFGNLFLADLFAILPSEVALPLEPLTRLLLTVCLPRVKENQIIADKSLRGDWAQIEHWGGEDQVTLAVTEVLAEFGLRLTLAGLEGFFRRLSQEKQREGMLLEIFCRVCSGSEAAAVAVFPTVLPRLITALKTDAGIKKKRRSPGHSDSPMRRLGLRSAHTALSTMKDLSEEALLEISDVAVTLVGLESEEELGALLVAIASRFGDASRKSMVTEILRHTRSVSAQVRAAAARLVSKLWKDLGVAMNLTASESLVFAVELEDDADEEVAAAARSLIKSVENTTGESIQDKIR